MLRIFRALSLRADAIKHFIIIIIVVVGGGVIIIIKVGKSQ